eukprot:scaffold33151_cov108-Isochrysis_galbana.AAC.2
MPAPPWPIGKADLCTRVPGGQKRAAELSPRARNTGELAHQCGDATPCREVQKGEPEVLVDVANDKADEPKEHHQDLESALAVQLALEVLRVHRGSGFKLLRYMMASLLNVPHHSPAAVDDSADTRRRRPRARPTHPGKEPRRRGEDARSSSSGAHAAAPVGGGEMVAPGLLLVVHSGCGRGHERRCSAGRAADCTARGPHG